MAIKKASDHFTDLMNSRSSFCAPGEITIWVSVPQQYVGVVVGRNGSTIMKIKEQTNTRINTPKDDAPETAFEVTGTWVRAQSLVLITFHLFFVFLF
jgi:predicted PilT family ATPase